MHEMQFAEKEIAANEDKILEMMVNADARDKEVKAAQAELKAETAEIEKEKEEARQRTAEDEKLLADGVPSAIRFAPASTTTCSVTTSVSPSFAAAASPRFAIRNVWPAASCSGRRPTTKFVPARRPSCATPASAFCISTPPTNLPIRSPRRTRPKRHHPKIDASQAWYYRSEFGGIGEVFLCLTNCSWPGQPPRLRRAHRTPDRRHPDPRRRLTAKAFPEDITDAMRLNGGWSENELDAFGSELPMVALDSLRADLDLARYEAATRSHVKPQAPTTPTEQAAR